jgi:hypothetical protein
VGSANSRAIPEDLEQCVSTCPASSGDGNSFTPMTGCPEAVLARAATWLAAWNLLIHPLADEDLLEAVGVAVEGAYPPARSQACASARLYQRVKPHVHATFNRGLSEPSVPETRSREPIV